MDSYKRIAELKIQTAQDRAHAVIEEVTRVEHKVYASPGSKCILRFVRDVAGRIDGLLEDQRSVVVADLLTPSQLEARLHRIAELLPVLHLLLGFVDGSDVHRAPGQLMPTLRRYVHSIFPSSEIVVSSKPELNYSIQDIAGSLKGLFSAASLDVSCTLLPELLFVVNIPAVESGQILIHGVLAHELGHALYDKKDIATNLLPKIKVNEELVKKLAKTMFENQQKQQDPTPELRLRELITREVAVRINAWIMELSSDAIGIRLFGPALFFAATHLLVSSSHLDKSSKTHPPPRLRIKLMIRMLKQLYSVESWREELQSFSKDWDAVSAGPIAGRTAFDQVAIENINDGVLDQISEASALATAEAPRYTSDQFKKDVAELTPLFLSHIPAGETGPVGRSTPTALVSVINAGWHVYLCDFEPFRKSLHPNDGGTRFAAAAKLHELILKSLEISGIRTSWEEARRDSKRGKN
jgi:hypothetical protein